MEIKLRASELKNIIADPLNYFKLIDNPTKETVRMRDGKEREVVSYLIYDKMMPEQWGDYEEQKAGEFEVEGVKITCHADIVHKNIIVDIKNSKLDDDSLIKNYWYQLNAYAYCFKCSEAYLFVDNNVGNEQQQNVCRFVKVDVNPAKFLRDLSCAIKVLKEIPPQTHTVNAKLTKLMSEYYDTQQRIESDTTHLNELTAEIEKLMKNRYSYEDSDLNLVCTKSYHKELTRKMQMVSETWNGKYKENIKVSLLTKK